MRRRAPRPLSTALEALRRELAPQSTLACVQSIWAQAVGDQIAAQASPVSEHAGTIAVSCSSAVWAADLQMREHELTDVLNAALPPERRILGMRFRAR